MCLTGPVVTSYSLLGTSEFVVSPGGFLLAFPSAEDTYFRETFASCSYFGEVTGHSISPDESIAR
jgi:hypothetical protein